ncbi:Metal resistance protein YCF1 [Candida viswanathii]|uniref:Metal resistance protein YCF1 n=1 Tax=Candida viswanathii TaxID=5486 RepID=A0A367YHK2_9ASCO|nr:Metal resistance protein YCF1 [Candida viswanathii]
MGVFMAFTNFTWNLAPFLVSCSTFAVFVWTSKKSLSTDLVFPALALFNLLSFPLAVVPMVITNIVEAQVAIGRLTKFLTSSELQTDAVIKVPRAQKVGDAAASIKMVLFMVQAKGEQNYKVALSNINLSAKKGHLDCIIGKVGSGKSSIIQAFLGDLYKLDGEVTLHGKVAYVSQVPWIINGTVKDNILFGHKYDAHFYDLVLKACALTVDLSILPKGDRTEVGEKGISLSGGQKARLSLARAVYARADVYLLDDPLSAVDEHVSTHLTDHVLGPNGLLKSKCRILATNNIKVLSIADSLNLVSDGRLVEQGTYDDIMKQDSSKILRIGRVVSLRRASEVSFDHEERVGDVPAEEDADTKARKEHLEQGKVKWEIYLEYAKACGPINVVIFLGFAIGSYWLTLPLLSGWNTGRRSIADTDTIQMLASTLKIHQDMADSVLRAPMTFFETTPIGRILNRFSNDIYKVDEIIGRVFNMFFSNSIKVFLTIIVIILLENFKELKRLDSVSRSPIFANFQESLIGVATIRAYGKEERFKHLNESRVDKNMSAYNPTINSNRWLAVRLEFLGSIIILGAAGLSILTLKTSHLSAGIVGLSVSYALQITQSLNWIVRMSVEVETNIVSVERCLEYSHLQAKLQISSQITAHHKPGQITEKSSSRIIPPSTEKIGIVGRTGAGKSSITLALFRIIEAFDGNISIDGVNTSEIGLYDLRHRLSIIPQDSQVFQGTIRSNLDPVNEFSDDQIWRALELAHLKEHD